MSLFGDLRQVCRENPWHIRILIVVTAILIADYLQRMILHV